MLQIIFGIWSKLSEIHSKPLKLQNKMKLTNLTLYSDKYMMLHALGQKPFSICPHKVPSISLSFYLKHLDNGLTLTCEVKTTYDLLLYYISSNRKATNKPTFARMISSSSAPALESHSSCWWLLNKQRKN